MTIQQFVIGVFALVLLCAAWQIYSGFKLRRALVRYSTEMQAVPLDRRLALGWPSDMPIASFWSWSMRGDMARGKLVYRHWLWGLPPIADIPQAAKDEFVIARRWMLCILLPALVIVILGGLLLFDWRFPVAMVAFMLIPILIFRPTRWPSGPS